MDADEAIYSPWVAKGRPLPLEFPIMGVQCRRRECKMLVFVDESGDAGLKINQGSSPHFVVALVVFEDNEEATVLEQRIQLLRHLISWERTSIISNSSSSEVGK